MGRTEVKPGGKNQGVKALTEVEELLEVLLRQRKKV